ncbi:hypothetical protein DRN58_05815 [Thermococci archaeon]|nr:MAG: hypothetical protein DRN58_05815 [Thermococci archaeon]
MISREIKNAKILKIVEKRGRIEFLRPNGTLYDVEGNKDVYLVELNGEKTLAIEYRGNYYEAFTIAGINTIKIV